MASRTAAVLARDYLPDEEEVLFVSTPTTRTPVRNGGQDVTDSVSKAQSASSVSDRHLMPPPYFAPVASGHKKPRNWIKPIQFVSNSVQKATFGETGRVREDTQRSATVKYDVNYKYTRPNYIVTDVPDLWADSSILVEKCPADSPISDEARSSGGIAEEWMESGEALSSISPSPSPPGSLVSFAYDPPQSPEPLERSRGSPVSPEGSIAEMDESILRISEAINASEIIQENAATEAAHPVLLAATEPLSDDETALDVLGAKKRKKKKLEHRRSKSKSNSKKRKPVDVTDSGGMAVLLERRQHGSPEKPKKSKKRTDDKKASTTGKRKSPDERKREHEERDAKKSHRKEKKERKIRSPVKRAPKEAENLAPVVYDIEDGEISSPPQPVSPKKAKKNRSPGRNSLRVAQGKSPRDSSKAKTASETSPRDRDRREEFSSTRSSRSEDVDDRAWNEAKRRSMSDDHSTSPRPRSSGSFSRRERSPFREDQYERRPSSSAGDRDRLDFRDRRRSLSHRSSSPRRDRRYSPGQKRSHDRSVERRQSDSFDRLRSPDRDSRRSRHSLVTSARSPESSISKPKPISFSLKRKSSRKEQDEIMDALQSLDEPNSDGVVKDILELIEQHLLTTTFVKEDGEFSSESDGSDTESVASISRMSLFGERKKRKPKVEDKKIRAKTRSPSREPEPSRRRLRSLSPYSTYQRPLPPVRSRPRRRSISPTWSISSLRRSRNIRNPRRHRASSFDTIASSQIDCARLREIAVKNALEFRRMGKIPPQYAMSAEERALWRSGGKTLEDLTAFCKRMAQRSRDGRACSRESSVAADLPKFSHPFHVKDRPLLSEIIMHINNARAVPIRNQQDRVVQNLSLRELFPVSSGSTHREMGWQRVVSHEKHVRPDDEDEKKKKKKKSKEEEPMTLEKQLRNAPPPPDYRIPISFSDKLKLLKFQRELAANPDNPEVLSQMQETQQQMLEWANQFCYTGAPGEFTGQPASPTPVKLHQPWETQAWARRDMLLNLKPVGGKGQYLLQKMGWLPGQGIGVGQHRNLEPLKMEIKMDKRGLVAEEEKRGKLPVFSNGVKTVSFGGHQDQHPCSALNEFCTKRGWGTPAFNLVDESGQPHRKTFLFQVKINGIDYRPTVTGCSKKLAKAEAARFCLEALGMVPQ